MPARTLPNLGLKAFYDLGEDGWKDDMDLNLLRLSVLTQGSVNSKVATEPGSPTNGDIHILDETNGTNPNKVIVRDNGAWVYITPVEGWLMFNRAADYYEKFDGTAWAELATGGGGGGGGGGSTVFSGALVGKTTDQAISTVTNTAVTFNTEAYDTADWHSNVTNNSRLTVPAGVSRVRLTARISRSIEAGQLVGSFRKNGVADVIGLATSDTDTAGGDSVSLTSAVIDVVPGDYFELFVFLEGASSVTTASWFSIEAVAVPPVEDDWLLLNASGVPIASGETHNFGFSPVATRNVINLAPFRHIRAVLVDVGTVSSGFRWLQVSYDNGATWVTSGYRIPNSAASNVTLDFNNAATNLGRWGMIELRNIKGPTYTPRLVLGDARNPGAAFIGVNEGPAINAIRIGSSGGDLNSGLLKVYGHY